MDRWKSALIAIVAAQVILFSIYIADPFVDGRLHMNWGPAFWLVKSEKMHAVNFIEAYLGAVADTKIVDGRTVAAGWYSSHPQFIAIPLYVWTGIFGSSEWVVRSLAALMTILTTVIFWFAVRVRHTQKIATLFALAWSFMPLYVAFGRKLDQEPFVMVAFALACLGHELFVAGDRPRHRIPWLWALGAFLMVWSDWSGFVIAGLLFLAQLFIMQAWRPARALTLGSLVGGGAGALIVATQSILQSGSVAGVVTEVTSLYKYRSGTVQRMFWYLWMRKQLGYFWDNFGWIVGYLGLATYMWYTHTTDRWSAARVQGYSIAHLCGIAALGCLVYALVVPQATYIHIYYQYFYGPAVAWGVVQLFLWGESYVERQRINTAIPSLVFAMALMVGVYHGTTILFVDRMVGWGWTGEIDLMKRVGKLPADKPVVAITGGSSINTWFDNPNIVYYAGRQIKTIDAPVKGANYPYVIIGNDQLKERMASLAEFATSNILYEKLYCSQALCLIGAYNK